MIKLLNGDCLDKLKELDDNSIDSIVTDPPYGLEFMGKQWDTFATGRISKYKEGGELNTENIKERSGKGGAGPSYTKRAAAKCKKCGRQRWSGNPCTCVEPDFEIDNSTQHTFQGFTEAWARECLRVLKPGGHLLAFGGSRMFHRLACGIEDAGFEVRDTIMWIYGSGFPKSHNIGKAIDKIEGNEREVLGTKADFSLDGAKRNPNNHREVGEAAKEIQHEYGYKQGWDAPVTKGNSDWEGWGTALKPAHEPIVMARKPLIGTVAENVLEHRVGGLNIDACRIQMKDGDKMDIRRYNEYHDTFNSYEDGESAKGKEYVVAEPHEGGRWPANIILDEEGNEEWRKYFYCPKANKKDRNEGMPDKVPQFTGRPRRDDGSVIYKETHPEEWAEAMSKRPRKDKTTLAASEEKLQTNTIASMNTHPTVKPTDLMKYLIRLVTPKGGIVLDPFMGSGSTGKAAMIEGMDFVGIEREKEYYEIAKQRIEHEQKKHKWFA